jgi:hypothetical protein
MSHNRIVEIEHKGEFHWEAQTADNIHELFTCCTLTFQELRAAWEQKEEQWRSGGQAALGSNIGIFPYAQFCH